MSIHSYCRNDNTTEEGTPMFRFPKQRKQPITASQSGPLVRRHVIFYGRVQGVGFRFQAVAICQSLGLTGWVRNCTDGSVEMEVQGGSDTIEALLKELRQLPYVRIDRYETESLPLEEERGFRATY